MLSLARGYVSRCIARQGKWTSGIHILWWTKESLSKPTPEVAPQDLIYQAPIRLERQIELARWSLLLLRLTYIADIGEYAHMAEDEPIGLLRNIAEEGAMATQSPSLRKLERWIRQVGFKEIDAILPESKYRQICQELRDKIESSVAQ